MLSKRLNFETIYLFVFLICILFNSLFQDKYYMDICFLVLNIVFIILNVYISKYELMGIIYILLLTTFYYITNRSISVIRYFLYICLAYTTYLVLKKILQDDRNALISPFVITNLFCIIVSITEVVFKRNYFIELLGESNPGSYQSGYRLSGITTHPLIFASILLLFVVIFFSYYINTHKYIYIGLCITDCVLIILTQSRSSMLALCVIILMYLLYIIRPQKRIVVRTILSLICVIIVIFFTVLISIISRNILYQFTYSRFLELFSSATSGSLYQRLGSIGFIINELKSLSIKDFVGHGYGNLISYLYNNKIFFVNPNFFTVDNQYVTWIYDIGIINTCLIIIYIMYLLVKSLRKHIYVTFYILLSIAMMIFFFEFTSYYILLILFPIPFSFYYSMQKDNT